jgi:hypothetical protein
MLFFLSNLVALLFIRFVNISDSPEIKQILLILSILFLLIPMIGILIIIKTAPAVLQHFSLRLVLTFNGYSPWNYAHFLDYCTEQMLLQRIGGGYRFIHRLLREHLLETKS